MGLLERRERGFAFAQQVLRIVEHAVHAFLQRHDVARRPPDGGIRLHGRVARVRARIPHRSRR